MNEQREAFEKILGHDGVSFDEADCDNYGQDWSKDFQGKAGCVLFPKSEAQIIEIIQHCIKERIPLIPSGGRTGLSAAATALNEEAVLSLDKMRTISEVDPVTQSITCQPGATTEQIQKAAESAGYYFPIDLASRGTSQIGGNVATNAGGIRVIRYGGMREWVRGLRAVTGSGTVISCPGDLVKNNTGYDFRSLFIGSEGTLGVITEVTLGLTLPPKDTSLYLLGSNKRDLPIDLLAGVRSRHRTISLFEFFTKKGIEKVIEHHKLSKPFNEVFDYFLLIEIESASTPSGEAVEEYLMSVLEEGGIGDIIKADSSKHTKELLSYRELIGETLSQHYSAHKNDISVPIPSIPLFHAALDEKLHDKYPELEYEVFGHIGDGNLHINLLKPESQSKEEFFAEAKQIDELLFGLVRDFRGSVSAEHGIGLLKREFLGHTRSQGEIALMREVKRVFDPLGILNPGKIFQ